MNSTPLSPLLQRTTLLISLAAGSFLLAACGGGSDNDSSASSSSLNSSSSLRSSFSAASVPANGSGIWPSIKVGTQGTKTLSFEWSPVEGASYYKLYKQDAENGTQLLADNLTDTMASDTIGVHLHDWINTRYWVEACTGSDCSNRSDLSFTATEMLSTIGYYKASNTGSFDWFGWSITLSADGQTMAIGAPAEDSKAIGVNGDQNNNESPNAGAVYVFVKENGQWVQQAYLKASNTEQPNIDTSRVLPNDRFGYRVALSDDGNTLAVSALLEDSPSFGINCNQDNYEVVTTANTSAGTTEQRTALNLDVGAVYMFSRNAGVWQQDAYVKPLFSALHAFNDPSVALRFGESIALSGDGKTLAVGTTQDFIGRSGVFNFSSAASSLACFDFYPSSRSSSSNSLSSSSSSSSSNNSSAGSSYRGGSQSGAVYTFRLGDNGWQQESHLKASNAEEGDSFGVSIALSTDGNTLVVGATGEDSNATGVNGTQSTNACYYFNEDVYTLTADCREATRYQIRGIIENGAAYVFQRAEHSWTQEAYLKPATTYFYTGFGASVDVSGDGSTLVIGAPGDAGKVAGINSDSTQDANFANTGAAYVFTKSGSAWAQQALIKPSTLTQHAGVNLVQASQFPPTFSVQFVGGGQFGTSVSLSENGDKLAIGSYREKSYALGINGDEGDTSKPDSGAVFVFARNNTVWSQKSYVKAPNTDAGDRFGLNIKLSGDGNDMLVSAHRESGKGYASVAASSGASNSSAASSVNGLDQSDNSLEASGAVYLY